jgi:hypothetical protein
MKSACSREVQDSMAWTLASNTLSIVDTMASKCERYFLEGNGGAAQLLQKKLTVGRSEKVNRATLSLFQCSKNTILFSKTYIFVVKRIQRHYN